jgi:hypothetical protein
MAGTSGPVTPASRGHRARPAIAGHAAWNVDLEATEVWTVEGMPLVFIGGAVIGTFDDEVIIGDRRSVTKIRDRIAVGIDERKVSVRDARVVDALLVQEKLGQGQHGDFLPGAVISEQRDLEAIASRVADRRFPHKFPWHGFNPIAAMDFITVQLRG